MDDLAGWTPNVDVPPKKTQITMRFDPDVIDFFKSQGGSYQTKMNAVLRSYMLWSKNKDASSA